MMWGVNLDHADVVLLRHGESTYNTAHLLNGDPSVEVPLTAAGIDQVRALRPALATISWASVVVTPFHRTWQTLDELLPGRDAIVDPDLGDICLGEFESRPREAYRTWRRTHGVDEAPTGGESRRAAVARYAGGLRRLASETPHPALVVTHDQPIRYLQNVLAGNDPILGPALPVPNATPYSFTREMLAEGARRLQASLG